MKTKCPNCHQESEVDDAYLHCSFECEACRSTFIVEAIKKEIEPLRDEKVSAPASAPAPVALLKKCAACGADVYMDAVACPGCGCPQQKTVRRFRSIVCGILFGLLFVLFCFIVEHEIYWRLKLEDLGMFRDHPSEKWWILAAGACLILTVFCFSRYNARSPQDLNNR